MERFVEALFSHGSGLGPLWWDKETLIEVAGIIVAERFAPKNFRTKEVRVSEQHILAGRERTHFVGPRSQDLEALMTGFVEAWLSHHLEELSRPVAGALDIAGAVRGKSFLRRAL